MDMDTMEMVIMDMDIMDMVTKVFIITDEEEDMAKEDTERLLESPKETTGSTKEDKEQELPDTLRVTELLHHLLDPNLQMSQLTELTVLVQELDSRTTLIKLETVGTLTETTEAEPNKSQTPGEKDKTMTTMPLVDQEDGEGVLLEAIPRILHLRLGEEEEPMFKVNSTTMTMPLRTIGQE